MKTLTKTGATQAVLIDHARHHTRRRHQPTRVALRFLAGRDLDGQRRTDARWSQVGMTANTPHGYASRWAHYPHRRRAGIRVLAATALVMVLLGVVANWVATVTTLRVIAWGAITVAVWVVVEKSRRYAHRREVVAPLAETLAQRLGDSRYVLDPRSWIQVPVDVQDRPTVVYLPKTYAPTETAEKALVRLVSRKIGLANPTSTFDYRGEKPFMELRPAPAPREMVSFTDPDVRAMVETTPDGRILLGLAPRDVPYTLDLDTEAPHVGFSMATGAGKSVAARAAVMQILRRGGLILVLDRKQVSQAWCRGLLGVRYASSPEEIHDALLWLSDEIDRRFDIIRRHADIRGNVDAGLIGPRMLVVAEELNTLEQDVSSYWRTIKQTGQPLKAPSLAALGRAMAMGRQGRVHVMPIGQKITAQSIGGTAARENMSTRVLGRATVSTWNMLAPECKVGGRYPKRSMHRGRVHVVADGEATPVQVMLTDEEDAREYAAGGISAAFPGCDVTTTVSETSADQPGNPMVNGFSTPVSQTDRHLQVVPDVDDSGEVAEESFGEPDPLTLTELTELGVLTGSMDAIRKAAGRPGFPGAVGKKGTAKTYNLSTVLAWRTTRDGDTDEVDLAEGCRRLSLPLHVLADGREQDPLFPKPVSVTERHPSTYSAADLASWYLRFQNTGDDAS